MIIRQPAFSGTFYPESPEALGHTVKDLLNKVEAKDFNPKALVVPHAGFMYSGLIAAAAYRLLLRSNQNTIRRVVLLGPCHRLPLHGMALPGCDAFSTPLGNIPLDTEALEKLEKFSEVRTFGDAHSYEHSLEVQCPFLQICLNNFKLIPIVVGNTNPTIIADVIESLWDVKETLVVISSDLSHFHSYDEAQYIDNETVKQIEALKNNLVGDQACGCYPLNGVLTLAQRWGMNVRTLDVCNSGDTAGDKSRVVGYGAFAIM